MKPIPIPPHLQARVDRLCADSGQTWAEICLSCPDDTTVEEVIVLQQGWLDLTPEQKAAWEQAAVAENHRRRLRSPRPAARPRRRR